MVGVGVEEGEEKCAPTIVRERERERRDGQLRDEGELESMGGS